MTFHNTYSIEHQHPITWRQLPCLKMIARDWWFVIVTLTLITPHYELWLLIIKHRPRHTSHEKFLWKNSPAWVLRCWVRRNSSGADMGSKVKSSQWHYNYTVIYCTVLGKGRKTLYNNNNNNISRHDKSSSVNYQQSPTHINITKKIVNY